MNIQAFNILYIVVHVIPYCDWQVMNYADKMSFHHVVMASGKTYPLSSLQSTDGCIEVAYVGSEPYARRSNALLALLLDLSIAHPAAQLVDSQELYESRPGGLLSRTAGSWLSDKLPTALQPAYHSFKNILFLRQLLNYQ
jgi:hypothetical protein